MRPPDRHTPRPFRRDRWLILALAALAFALSSVLIASQIASCSNAKGSQVPDPTPFVEADCYRAIVDQYARIGRNIPPNSPDQALAHRRESAGDQVDWMGRILAESDRQQFQAVIDYACAALRTYWPHKWETSPPCQN